MNIEIQLKIYRVSLNEQDLGNHEWDYYDSMVVIAENDESARHISPRSGEYMNSQDWEYIKSSWTDDPGKLIIEPIGIAKQNSKVGLILSSFHPG